MFQPNALLPEMDKLRRFALRLTRNDSDADDLLQATMVRALEKMDLFKEDTKLFSWVSKIMFNIFAGQYRHKRKFQTQYDPEHYIERMSVSASQEISTDLKTVGKCMDRMTAEHREILVMICAKGMKYDEVAEELQIPLGTVRSRLSRARTALQLMLAPTTPDIALIPPYIAAAALAHAAA